VATKYRQASHTARCTSRCPRGHGVVIPRGPGTARCNEGVSWSWMYELSPDGRRRCFDYCEAKVRDVYWVARFLDPERDAHGLERLAKVAHALCELRYELAELQWRDDWCAPPVAARATVFVRPARQQERR
jgi:hypothetical protein